MEIKYAHVYMCVHAITLSMASCALSKNWDINLYANKFKWSNNVLCQYRHKDVENPEEDQLEQDVENKDVDDSTALCHDII